MPYEHMRVWDAADEASGPSTLRFDADEFAVANWAFIVENQLLQDALLRVLDRSDVNLRFSCPIRAFGRDDGRVVNLTLEDGRVITNATWSSQRMVRDRSSAQLRVSR